MDRNWQSRGKRFRYWFLQDVWSKEPSRIWRKARYYSANSLPYIRQKSFTTALVLFVILHRFFRSRILENSSAFPYSYSEQFSHLKKCVLNTNSHIIRELKQQRRRRLQTLSRLFHLVYFIKCWQMFLELNSKGLYQSSGKEEKVVVLCSRPRQNVNSGTFTLQSGNDGKEMYKKSVMHVQSCCSANQTHCFFAVLVAVRVVVA